MKITVETLVKRDLNTVWSAWNNPEDIKQWNAGQAILNNFAQHVQKR